MDEGKVEDDDDESIWRGIEQKEGRWVCDDEETHKYYEMSKERQSRHS